MAADDQHPGRASTAWTVSCLVGIAGWIGTKKAIFVGLVVYCGVSIYGYGIDSAAVSYQLIPAPA